MMTKREIKHLVDGLCGLADQIAPIVGFTDVDLAEAFRIELAKFMMYLSASDGTIESNEADLISYICDMELSAENVGGMIRELNIYSTEFEQTVPPIFELFVTTDKMFLDGEDGSASKVYIDIIREAGQALIISDGDVDENEVADFNIYIDMLEEYRNDNLLSENNNTTGFSKNNGSVSAPSKGSVSAPRKG